jgi:lipopolysaccharide export system permease protein
VLCGICAFINLQLGPMCRKAYKDLRFQFLAEISGALLPERQFIRDISPGFIFYVGRNRAGNLEDILLVQNDASGSKIKVRAERGRLEVDATNNVFRLRLSGVRGVMDNQHPINTEGEQLLEFPMTKSGRSARRASLSDLTFQELQAELRDLEARLDATPASNNVGNAARQRERLRKDALSPVRVELHRKVALSFSCFGFALIGIPLGIRVQRRESNIGFAVALVLVVVYYAFILAGSALESKSDWRPHLWMWAPNFLFQIVGIRLLWRANRGL